METLPKRWFINVKDLSDEDRETVGDFYNSHCNTGGNNCYTNRCWNKLFSHNNDNIYIGDGDGCTRATFSSGYSKENFEYKEITIEQFKLLVMEILPEAWYITTTEESNDIVCDWYKKQGHSYFNTNIGNHIGVSSRGVIGYMGVADPKKNFKGGVELTFEQFKKLVLKE